MWQISDDEITKGINSLNSKQREFFNIVYTLAKVYIKYDGFHSEPVHIFLSASGVTGKFHLVKVIYNAICKTLLYNCKDPETKNSFTWNYRSISSKHKWNRHLFRSWN